MAHQFCDHLDEYGAQYAITEASYQQCVSLVDRIMSAGPTFELVGLVTAALQEWNREDQKLREMLVTEVQAGRVRVPSVVAHRHNRATQRKARQKRSRPICAACRFKVPRLEYPEWKIAHNGEASFRGLELSVPSAH